MSALNTPLMIAAVVALAGGGVYAVKSRNVQRDMDRLAGKRNQLQGQLDDLEAMKADTARILSATGTRDQLAAARQEQLGRALGKKELAAVVERLRASAQKYALGKFDPARAVKESQPLARSPRLSKVDLQVEVATDWARLGALLGEVRALAPRVLLEETTIHRAEDVELLGVRLVLVALVAAEGGAPGPAPAAEDRFAGPSPFFLASELAEQRSRRMAPPWTPPRVELEGIIYTKGASHVIVNDEPVLEGKTFAAGTETVKVIEVTPSGARFQVGERIFERELPSLRGGGK